MFTRVLTFAGAHDVDGGLRYVRDEATPVLRQQHGFRGITVSADRSAGVLGVLSLWETEAYREASDSALLKNREEGQRIAGGHLTVETFEEIVREVVQPLVAGSSALHVRRISMAPDLIEENVEFFKQVVLPELKAQPGFQAVRNMIDRRNGSGIVGTVWSDRNSMEAAAAANEQRRQRAAERGVVFGDESKREILFVELS
jgi:heme-degrading monooxygenase HmoA